MFPQLLFTVSLMCEKALCVFCEESDKETEALSVTVPLTFLPLPALLLLRNKLPKAGWSGCRHPRLPAGSGAPAETGGMGREKAPSATWPAGDCTSLPFAPFPLRLAPC